MVYGVEEGAEDAEDSDFGQLIDEIFEDMVYGVWTAAV